MSLVDTLLNLAALLLWLGWRAIGLATQARPAGLSLVSTLERAEPRPVRRWPPLLGLAGLLLIRPVLYWQVGAPAHWKPMLDLGLIAVPFRTTAFSHMLVYSFLGFGRALILFHLALVCLCLINRGVSDADAVQCFVRMQLGAVARWPSWGLGSLPLFGCALLWLALEPPLSWMGLVEAAPTVGLRLWESLLLGLAAYLTWKYLLAAMLVGYLIHSHVFVGHSKLWSFVGVTGQNLLRPLRVVPLTIRRFDAAPLVALGSLWAAAHLATLGLTRGFQHPPF